jgi:hypothetical protein
MILPNRGAINQEQLNKKQTYHKQKKKAANPLISGFPNFIQ